MTFPRPSSPTLSGGRGWLTLQTKPNQTKKMTAYERKKSLMTTADIQRELDMIRLAYRERGEPLNRRRFDPARWIAYGLAIGAIIAAASYF